MFIYLYYYLTVYTVLYCFISRTRRFRSLHFTSSFFFLNYLLYYYTESVGENTSILDTARNAFVRHTYIMYVARLIKYSKYGFYSCTRRIIILTVCYYSAAIRHIRVIEADQVYMIYFNSVAPREICVGTH